MGKQITRYVMDHLQNKNKEETIILKATVVKNIPIVSNIISKNMLDFGSDVKINGSDDFEYASSFGEETLLNVYNLVIDNDLNVKNAVTYCIPKNATINIILSPKFYDEMCHTYTELTLEFGLITIYVANDWYIEDYITDVRE